jgi:hypothetical protein
MLPQEMRVLRVRRELLQSAALVLIRVFFYSARTDRVFRSWTATASGASLLLCNADALELPQECTDGG